MHRLAPEGLEAALTAVVVMSLVVSATLNGQRPPCTYLKDVPTRLPTLPNSRMEELLPHLWPPPA